ncbi:Phosphoethanolamine transferase for glucans (OPG), alkaline phosphatase superfamily [Parasphingorhabdus marina DSM 22363]|uniref:Phosphoethanolamine transferase for glucans (OPG), alkaline phosphatase superfamily n=1 Tax=Parasphingorhabdus marina DSM 22363 TaxID=1123272 RepID=A0A1N6CSN8_9SPHN|nr:sulfatase-like hydrolase/transferase [Parasphingorhabdus marina]SIN61570.1 Phosphoethanolamine transferase for glucans (OPG), alkaline phosphatase superfamily [Parasphingorhabdus marina DSM 22363]
MRNRWKILLILLSLLLGGQEVLRRIDMLTTPSLQIVGLTAYLILFVLCLTSAIGAAFIRQSGVRWTLAILLASGSWLVDGYQWAVGDFMTYDAFVTMVQSAGDLTSAFQQQAGVMALAAVKAGLLLVGTGLQPGTSIVWWKRIAAWLALPILLMLTILLFLRGGEGGSGLPSSHFGLSFGALQGYETLTRSGAPRETVTWKPVQQQPAGDIVLIVDESIAGAYLDINDKHGVYSGLDRTDERSAIHNFGLAVSITHCSVGSNLSLRYGGTRDNYQNRAERGPSIWAFAAAAGRETIYIDAQRTGGTRQNQMTETESREIDQWIQLGDVPVRDRDHAVADKLAGFLSDNHAQFILINKVGAHFPVNDKFPDSHAHYRPMLERGQFANVTDMASRDELDGRASNWVRYRNSYRNSLTWQVGGFFDRLFAQASMDNNRLVYTADHGQHLHEEPDDGTATHCTADPEIEEAVVPLVVIGGGSPWRDAAQEHHDRTSHYRIFPTLLGLMGYERDAVRPLYGPDLLASDPDPFTFNIRYNARLGRDPVWRHVPLGEIARPPVSDHAGSGGPDGR